MILAGSRVCYEGALEGFIAKIVDGSLWNLDPRPFYCDEGDVDPSCLCYPAEFEKEEMCPRIQLHW